MTEIQAVSKDTLIVSFNNEQIEISTGESIIFTENFEIYTTGDTLTVEPEMKENTYMLRLWSEKHSVKFIPLVKIIELYKNNVIKFP